MTQEQIQKFLVESIIDNVVKYIIEDDRVDITTAMDIVYKSPVIKWLEDPYQDLQSQSPGYIYELIKRTNRLNQNQIVSPDTKRCW